MWKSPQSFIRPACAVLLLAATALPASAQRPAATPAKGEAIYTRECAMCHGVKGDGEGPGAHVLNPRPRNFELGVFKLRTTPSGQPPTDDDLFRVITQGLANTAMPAFKELPEADRWALVAVVKKLADIKSAPRPIIIPPEPASTPALLQKGRQVYAALKCFNCHGDDGKGDGPSSLTLKDDAKRRIWAPDITRGSFKSGSDAKALYARIATGIDGTPVPSYSGEAKPDEIWALVKYMMSITK